MRDATRIEGITAVAVADVTARDRLRPVSEAGVAALLSSIEDLGGITDPIHVRRVKHRGGELALMAGAHRLEAAKRLGWAEIPAVVWDCSDDWAVLKEIDDNAAGAELTPLDTAVFLAERKRVYEKLHPETRADAFRGNQYTEKVPADTMSVATFAAATAEKFGISEKHVRRLIAAGRSLDAQDREMLRRAPRAVTLADLQVLSKVTERAERNHVVETLWHGEAKSAAEARRQWKTRDEVIDPPDPIDTAYLKLLEAWKRAPKPARRRFVEEIGDDLSDDGGVE